MKVNWRIIVGVIVLVFGAILLLQQVGVLPVHGDLFGFIMAALFFTGGAAFLVVLIADKRNWWAAIPGLTLLGISFLIGSDLLFPALSGEIAPAIFMACMAASFWIIFFLDNSRWWAIIPGGVLLSVAAVIVAGSAGNGNLGVGLMFTGMALTFGVVGLLPNNGHRMNWAFIPGGILMLMGLSFLFAAGSWMRYLLPAGLVLGGIVLISLTVFRKKA
jgi:hypothetical protein